MSSSVGSGGNSAGDVERGPSRSRSRSASGSGSGSGRSHDGSHSSSGPAGENEKRKPNAGDEKGSYAFSANQLMDMMDQDDIRQRKAQLEVFGGIEGLAKGLRTSLEQGLAVEDDITERTTIYGENRLPAPPHKKFWAFVGEALSDRTILLLGLAALASIIIGVTVANTSSVKSTSSGWAEGVTIFGAIFIIAAVGALNSHFQTKRFVFVWGKQQETKCVVLRHGRVMNLVATDIRVGDLVMLQVGDIVPADCLVIVSTVVKLKEFASLKDAEEVKKDAFKDPFIYAGGHILEGEARAMVLAVGQYSRRGKWDDPLAELKETPLQQDLERFAGNVGKIGLALGVLLLVILTVKYFITIFVTTRTVTQETAITLTSYAITCISLVVVAVPEGLPLAVVLALAFSVNRMLRDGNLVRRFESVVTMGSVNAICINKSLLTTGEMTFEAGYVAKNDFHIRLDGSTSEAAASGEDDDKYGILKKRLGKLADFSRVKDWESFSIISLVVHCIALCTDADEIESPTPSDPDAKTWIGDAVDRALLKLSLQLGGEGFSYRDLRYFAADAYVRTYPLIPKTKRVCVLYRKPEGGYRLYVKGGAEIVAQYCSHQLARDGRRTPIGSTEKIEISARIHYVCNLGMHALSLAYRDFDEEVSETELDNTPDVDLTLIAVLGMRDPVRHDVHHPIKMCRQAGLAIRVVTGDNITTAISVARHAGILTQDGICMEGRDLRRLQKDELALTLPRLQVLARALPADKRLLIEALQKISGDKVAVTGSALSDEHSMKVANVSFCLSSGSEVIKAASDITLLDDGFKGIYKAVMWGRNIYESALKFLQFQLTVNIVAVLIVFIGSISSGGTPPINAVELLWINLIMDVFAALALATETPTEAVMMRKVMKRTEPLISKAMWVNITGQAAAQLALLLTALYLSEHAVFDFQLETEIHFTVMFNIFVLYQVFNLFNCRQLNQDKNIFKNLHKSYLLLGSFVVIVLVQFLLVQFANSFAHTKPLTGNQWGACILAGFFSIPVGALLRLVPVSEVHVDKEFKRNAADLAIWAQIRSGGPTRDRVEAAFTRSPAFEHFSSSYSN